MKTIILKALFVCSFIAALVSCSEITPVNNNNNNEGNGTRIEKLGVNLEPETKVTLSGDPAIFRWTTGDTIAVWKGTSDASGGYEECIVADDNSDHSISVRLADGENRFNYAIYPASVRDDSNYGKSTLKVILPSTYTYERVCGDNTPLPMVAVNDYNSSQLVFYNVGGLLRLTVSGIPTEDGTYLKVDFNGKDVCGSFTVNTSTPNQPKITAGTTGNNDKITITNLGGRSEVTINIPVPYSISYKDIIVSAWKGAVPEKAQVLPFRTIERAHGRRLTVPLSLGVFSGASNKYFVFSPGNLRASTTNGTAASPTWTWSFPDHQYDYLGSQNSSLSTQTDNGVMRYKRLYSASGSRDVFGWVGYSADIDSWGLDATGSSASDAVLTVRYGNKTKESLKTDWGSFSISISSSTVAYAANTWRTPVTDFEYALGNSRAVTNSLGENVRFTMANIVDNENSHKGLIIFPDHYTQPAGVTIGGSPVYNAASNYTATISSLSDWQKMEAAGAVFLPAAGHGTSGGSPVNCEVSGNYWVNRADDSTQQSTTKYAMCMSFYGSNTSQTFHGNALDFRYDKKAVRLIRDIR